MDTSKRKITYGLMAIIFLPFGCNLIRSSSQVEEPKIEFVVSFINMTELNSFTYELKNNSIKVWSEGELIYKSQVSSEHWLNIMTNKQALKGLSVYYDSNEMDGFVWKVVVRQGGDVNFVYLNNVCFQSTNSLFTAINSLLPRRVERIFIKPGKCMDSREE